MNDESFKNIDLDVAPAQLIQPDDSYRYNNADMAHLTNKNRRNTKLKQDNVVTQSFQANDMLGARC